MRWCILKWNSSTRATGIVTISIKKLEFNFGKSIFDNCKWDKIIEGMAKSQYLEQSETLFER